MTNENTTEVEETPEETNEYEVTNPEYEIADFIDDAISEGQWTTHMRSQYVYEFKQGGKLIRGLTAAAIAHIALENNISVTETTREIFNDGVLYTAVAVKVEPDKPEPEWLRAEGVAYEPFKTGNRLDKFCFQKCLTKARRNAQIQLIPATMRLQAIDKLLQLPQTLDKPLQPPQQAALPQPQEQPTEPAPENLEDKARREAFAVAREHEPELEKLGITAEAFWQGVRDHYGVESRKDMTLIQWKNVTASLRVSEKTDGVYASWIRNLIPLPIDTTPVEEQETTEEKLPF